MWSKGKVFENGFPPFEGAGDQLTVKTLIVILCQNMCNLQTFICLLGDTFSMRARTHRHTHAQTHTRTYISMHTRTNASTHRRTHSRTQARTPGSMIQHNYVPCNSSCVRLRPWLDARRRHCRWWFSRTRYAQLSEVSCYFNAVL